MTRRFTLWLPPLLYMAAIFHFSSQSDPLPVVTTHVWDKFLHLVEYAGLAALVYRALAGEGLPPLRAAVAAILFTSTYGITDEFHQFFVPLRSPDVLDWLTDTLGAVAGVITYENLIRLHVRRVHFHADRLAD